jgi:beta-glucosidase
MDWKSYADTARLAAAEGAVLLRNEAKTLPLKPGVHAAVFGRIQFHYYKSGTGSGGMVNVPYETNIVEALKASGMCMVDEKIELAYMEWLKEHPFDKTFSEKECWTIEPWAQEEMPMSEELVAEAAERNDVAIIILGRTAGEERDSKAEKGSWYLSDVEMDMVQKVTFRFERTVVLLNVANIMDMSWVEQCKPSAVLYLWQGGMEGGNAAADLLLGNVNPSGKLSDTIAYQLEDYPSDLNFGSLQKNIYQEDIYIGYRYFKTFAPEKIQYPFGYGLSYTEFDWTVEKAVTEQGVRIEAKVSNIGDTAGKEVLQVYLEKPMGLLGNPKGVLVDFEKTRVLMPGETQTIVFHIPYRKLASYDDSGITGYKSAYVMEAGKYYFYVGNSSENLKEAGALEIGEDRVLEQLEEALAPTEGFERMRPMRNKEGKLEIAYETVPVRTVNPYDRIKKNCPEEVSYTGNKGWKLKDVKEGKTTMHSFLAQLSDLELSGLIRGEGMCSPKVTSGTAAAFGGVTKNLREYGIPIGCCADGPSGIRRDDGHQAFSIPIGTALACTFHPVLVEQLFCWMGKELKENRIEVLLGPGMNIHRHPLNGRNFEYFSEDPLLTGKIAAAEMRGMRSAGVTGTLKHFAANNQETARTKCNAVVSERALREIYLKGFEIAVEESEPLCVMSTYGPVNGIWTAGNYDLLTVILRKEWGYEGLVMTDWWAQINDEGEAESTGNTTAMVRAQNDLYMVVNDAETNSNQDNTLEGLKNGKISRAELVRNAANICRVLMRIGNAGR